MRRVLARATLLAIQLREAIDYGLERKASNDETIHKARELRREIRQTRATS